MIRGIRLFLLNILMVGAFYLPGCGGGGGSSAPPVNIEPLPLTGTVVSKAAVLSGAEAVPPVVTGASGSGVLDVSMETGVVRGSVTFQAAPPLTAVTAVHVQQGARGANGNIVIALENAGSGVWSVSLDKVLTPAQVNSFLTGNFYFNVRTEANPFGEIRGQIDVAVSPAAGGLN